MLLCGHVCVCVCACVRARAFEGLRVDPWANPGIHRHIVLAHFFHRHIVLAPHAGAHPKTAHRQRAPPVPEGVSRCQDAQACSTMLGYEQCPAQSDLRLRFNSCMIQWVACDESVCEHYASRAQGTPCTTGPISCPHLQLRVCSLRLLQFGLATCPLSARSLQLPPQLAQVDAAHVLLCHQHVDAALREGLKALMHSQALQCKRAWMLPQRCNAGACRRGSCMCMHPRSQIKATLVTSHF